MILDITGDQIEQLNDTDLRTLVASLCEREVRAKGHSPAAVTWGGHQNAGDGGIDVRVTLPAGAAISGYVPKQETGIQVKAQSMPKSAILDEMKPEGTVLPAITELAAKGGAYIIASSKDSTADKTYKARIAAMTEAIAGIPSAASLTLDFYDRQRIASWVNQHAGLVPWVREKLGLPLSGWRPFEDWSSSPASLDAQYLLDKSVRLVGPSIKNSEGIDAAAALTMLRELLAKPKGVVRLVGLSGVGKTRLIQALFDERIGENALARSDALYTDISDEPDPIPQEMLSRLINSGQRVVLIVDSCGIELHRKLAEKISGSDCTLSVITVEYDINDDEPQNTDIFKLEPASPDLIEKILEARYPAIADPSRRVIAKFSEGNARVAFALAETAKNGESLANLHDSALFERLFYQQKASSPDLLDAAKACALLYSFDGVTLDGDASELAVLAGLVGQTADQLHKHVAELHRRQLAQKRSQWRAILPHALANRLAKRALEDIPAKRIEDAIINGKSGRVLRSFSRRMGYLHDNEHAKALAGKWFGTGGLLAELGKLSSLGEEIFENIAPLDPAATLSLTEQTAAKDEEWFFGEGNANRRKIIQVIRSIAYDAALFDRSARLLKRFALNEGPKTYDSALEPLKSFFWLYLSGTHASAAQRAAFIKELLHGSTAREQELGISLLGEMLKTGHFTSSSNFEFGAWKRDYGFYPRTGAQITDWYKRVMEVASAAEEIPALSSRIRRVMAIHLAELMRVGMVNDAILIAERFAAKGGWPEGWLAVRRVMRKDAKEIPSDTLKKLEKLEESLKPADLAAMIRSHAFSPEWGAIDIADLDEEEEAKPMEARQKVFDVCEDLGRQLAQNPEQFDALIAEAIAAESNRTLALGQGLAAGCSSLAACWNRLKDEFLKIPQGTRRTQLLSGFLCSAMSRDVGETEEILDGVLADARLHPYLVGWQSNIVSGKAYERLMKAVKLDTVPVSSFIHLAGGRAHEGLDDEQARTLLNAIAARPDGTPVAVEILGMRIFGRRSDKLPISDLTRVAAREILSVAELDRCSRVDYMLGQIVSVAFDKPESEIAARAFCDRIIAALESYKISGWELIETVSALAKSFPRVVLDIFVEQMADENSTSLSLLPVRHTNHRCPIEAMPPEAWLSWAAEKPETRYELLARVIRFGAGQDEDHVNGWSSAAIKLMESAPDPAKVLNAFYERFRPQGGWSGSLADTLRNRVPLIDVLAEHANPQIAGWAKERAPVYAEFIERHRSSEAAEARQRDQSFE